MVKPPEGGGFWVLTILVVQSTIVNAQVSAEYGCPAQEKILPCRCSTRDMEFQIWCSHSELPKVLEGLNAVSKLIGHPIDELILENNNLPSLPGKVFASLRVLRLMLRNNRLERVSSSWLEGLHDSLLELFVVEPDLRSLPDDSLDSLQGLEAVTLQSRIMKRLPRFTGLAKLRYLQVNSPSLVELNPIHFRDLPMLEQLHIFGSPHLVRIEAGLLRDLPRLALVNISESGVHWIHPRALIGLPELKEISLIGNRLVDAAMIGRAVMDLPSLSVLNLNRNLINRIGESAFVELPMLTRLSLSHNRITEILTGAFQRVPALRVLDVNHNSIHRIHPDFFYPQRGGGSLEEVWLINNDLGHVTELRAVLEALPKLKLLDASSNQLTEIPYGALRGHPTLERLHLDHNRLTFLQRESFSGMPALRELRLRNNSLTNQLEAPFWNLPALKGLDLSGNYLRHIESRLLSNLPNLRKLDVSENAIAMIDPDSFIRTPALEYLNISGNVLSVVHPMTFRHLTNLYELDLSWNRLIEVTAGLPRNLEHLYLSMNRISQLPPLSSHILSLPAMRSLDLSANGIERIPPGTFSKLPNLRMLNLGYNSLNLIEEDTFDGLVKLEKLDLRLNRLVDLHAQSLRPLRRLADLNLQENRLETLRPDLFHHNMGLERLDLSRNNLAQIPHATFATTRNLRQLMASYNSLSELPASLHSLHGLQLLDLSFNKLNILSPETLSSLTSLLELKLVRNKIKELREGAFDGLPRLALIDLENNDLRVIERNAIRALPQLQAIKLGKNRIQVIPSGAFAELPMLQSAELQENRLREIANSAFINVPHLLFLNLSYNLLPSLDYMGLESMRSLEVLDVSNNRLTKVSSDHLSAMEWLVELKMDNNRICSIQGSPFDDMPRLRVLSLRHNRMATVSENAFKRLRSNIAVLDIDGNPLSCSCGMIWLRGWLQQASADGPRCADGSLFKQVRLSMDDCQRERQIEPVHPGCETEMIDDLGPTAADQKPWLSYQQSENSHSSVDSDYTYDDYTDYSPLNMTEPPASTTTQQKLPFRKPATLATPIQILPKPQNPSKQNIKNVTQKKPHPWTVPSPSSSGFTFFGVPLPSLNLNLWSNSGKKGQRKEESSSRPSRSQSPRFQLPQIQRGGFMPLPKGEGGFLPISDPKTFLAENETLHEAVNHRASLKHSNYTIAKIERTSGFRKQNDSNLKSRNEVAGDSSYLPSSVDAKQVSHNLNDPSLEVDETMVSTEIYEGESLEIGSDKDSEIVELDEEVVRQIVLTTQPPGKTDTVIKERIGASVEVVTSETSENIVKLDQPPEFNTETSTQGTRELEASALSSFLVPNGQAPLSRPMGRPIITKIQSPFYATSPEHLQNQNITNKIEIITNYTDTNKNEMVDGNLVENNPYNWYFKQYNDTDTEPYVAVLYSCATKSAFPTVVLLLVVNLMLIL